MLPLIAAEAVAVKVAARYYVRYNVFAKGATMAQLKVIQIGNSLGVVLPKDILYKLGAEKGDVLHVSEAPGGEFRVGTRSPKVQRQIDLGEEIMKEYRDTFAALAK